ncbi:hypothetical protein EYF80_024846 [Liparis tanakae]|uniref:Uncharacterized protein n=1 Tax=Liparis tanakae TaxID=230148 RepID=A0A4Z2HJC2_9TELE|nr:hypothetical protein EYF80_024846 [Liparis tanakae]
MSSHVRTGRSGQTSLRHQAGLSSPERVRGVAKRQRITMRGAARRRERDGASNWLSSPRFSAVSQLAVKAAEEAGVSDLSGSWMTAGGLSLRGASAVWSELEVAPLELSNATLLANVHRWLTHATSYHYLTSSIASLEVQVTVRRIRVAFQRRVVTESSPTCPDNSAARVLLNRNTSAASRLLPAPATGKCFCLTKA